MQNIYTIEIPLNEGELIEKYKQLKADLHAYAQKQKVIYLLVLMLGVTLLSLCEILSFPFRLKCIGIGISLVVIRISISRTLRHLEKVKEMDLLIREVIPNWLESLKESSDEKGGKSKKQKLPHTLYFHFDFEKLIYSWGKKQGGKNKWRDLKTFEELSLQSISLYWPSNAIKLFTKLLTKDDLLFIRKHLWECSFNQISIGQGYWNKYGDKHAP